MKKIGKQNIPLKKINHINYQKGIQMGKVIVTGNIKDSIDDLNHAGVKGMKWRKGKVSKEYLEEREYNSRKNVYPNQNKRKNSSKDALDRAQKLIDKNRPSSKKRVIEKERPTNTSGLSKEYLEEREYNSRENVYPREMRAGKTKDVLDRGQKLVDKEAKKNRVKKIINKIRSSLKR